MANEDDEDKLANLRIMLQQERLIMLVLIFLVFNNDYFMPLSAVKLAFEITSPGSKLRAYMARDLIYSSHMNDCTGADLDVLGGSVGFIGDFTKEVTFKYRERDVADLRTEFGQRIEVVHGSRSAKISLGLALLQLSLLSSRGPGEYEV